MTSADDTAGQSATRLGMAAARRWGRPSAPHRPRPAMLGIVAAAASRFARGIGRAPALRRQLAGPGPIRPVRHQDPVAPPRWWTPTVQAESTSSSVPALTNVERGWSGTATAAPTLPPKVLRRAVHAIENEQTHVPGGMAGRMAGQVIRVRRVPDVTAAGPMRDAGVRLTAPARRSQPPGSGAGPPGQRAGSMTARPSAAADPMVAGAGRTAPHPARTLGATLMAGRASGPGPQPTGLRTGRSDAREASGAPTIRRAWTGGLRPPVALRRHPEDPSPAKTMLADRRRGGEQTVPARSSAGQRITPAAGSQGLSTAAVGDRSAGGSSVRAPGSVPAAGSDRPGIATGIDRAPAPAPNVAAGERVSSPPGDPRSAGDAGGSARAASGASSGTISASTPRVTPARVTGPPASAAGAPSVQPAPGTVGGPVPVGQSTPSPVAGGASAAVTAAEGSATPTSVGPDSATPGVTTAGPDIPAIRRTFDPGRRGDDGTTAEAAPVENPAEERHVADLPIGTAGLQAAEPVAAPASTWAYPSVSRWAGRTRGPGSFGRASIVRRTLAGGLGLALDRLPGPEAFGGVPLAARSGQPIRPATRQMDAGGTRPMAMPLASRAADQPAAGRHRSETPTAAGAGRAAVAGSSAPSTSPAIPSRPMSAPSVQPAGPPTGSRVPSAASRTGAAQTPTSPGTPLPPATVAPLVPAGDTTPTSAGSIDRAPAASTIRRSTESPATSPPRPESPGNAAPSSPPSRSFGPGEARPSGPTPTQTSSAGQPSVGQPSVGQPSVGQPSVGQPSVGQPSVGQPSPGPTNAVSSTSPGAASATTALASSSGPAITGSAPVGSAPTAPGTAAVDQPSFSPSGEDRPVASFVPQRFSSRRWGRPRPSGPVVLRSLAGPSRSIGAAGPAAAPGVLASAVAAGEGSTPAGLPTGIRPGSDINARPVPGTTQLPGGAGASAMTPIRRSFDVGASAGSTAAMRSASSPSGSTRSAGTQPNRGTPATPAAAGPTPSRPSSSASTVGAGASPVSTPPVPPASGASPGVSSAATQPSGFGSGSGGGETDRSPVVAAAAVSPGQASTASGYPGSGSSIAAIAGPGPAGSAATFAARGSGSTATSTPGWGPAESTLAWATASNRQAAGRVRSASPLRRTTLAQVGAAGTPGILGAVLSAAGARAAGEAQVRRSGGGSTSEGLSTSGPTSRWVISTEPGRPVTLGAWSSAMARSAGAGRSPSLPRVLGPLPEIAARGNAARSGAPRPTGVVRRSVGSSSSPNASGRGPTARASTASEPPGRTSRSGQLGQPGPSMSPGPSLPPGSWGPGQIIRRETGTLDRTRDSRSQAWTRALPPQDAASAGPTLAGQRATASAIGGSWRAATPTVDAASGPGSANRRTFADVQVGTARLLSRPPVAPPRGTPQPGGGTGPAAPHTPPTAVPVRPAAAAPAAPPTNPLVQSAPASLISQIPASLFERARAELGGSIESQPPVAPPALAQASLSVTGATGGTQVTQPERRAEPVPLADQLTWQEWNQLVDIVVDRLEQRVVDELARRGRRFTPGVF